MKDVSHSVTHHIDGPFSVADRAFGQFFAKKIAVGINQPWAGPSPHRIGVGRYQQRKNVSPTGGWVNTTVALVPADQGTDITYSRPWHGLLGNTIGRGIAPMAWPSLFRMWHRMFQQYLGTEMGGTPSLG